MNLLSDIITYVRRIIKSPSNSVITDELIIDYINRFWIMDVDARLQLFDLKTKYQFQTQPGVDKYNMPLYTVQTEPGNQTIGMYPVYQGFIDRAYINGVPVALQTEKKSFFGGWFNQMQNLPVVAVGNGGSTYTIQVPIISSTSQPVNPPFQGIMRGHVDISGIIALGTGIDPPIADNTGSTIPSVPVTSALAEFFITSLDSTGANIVISDSGQFLDSNVNCGLLMFPGQAPFGNQALSAGYSATLNTINYFTGLINIDISPQIIPAGTNINIQCRYFQSGLPREILYYNNTLTMRVPPAQQYLVELDAYLTPAAFLSTGSAIQFGYMSEYLARGAARKILSDTGDVEQFMFYEPLFKEQELLVWKRSQRQWTNNRTQTLYSQGNGQLQGGYGYGNGGGNTI